MDTKVLFIAPLATLLLAVGSAALAATPSGDAATLSNESGAMQTPLQSGSPQGMSPMMRDGRAAD